MKIIWLDEKWDIKCLRTGEGGRGLPDTPALPACVSSVDIHVMSDCYYEYFTHVLLVMYT